MGGGQKQCRKFWKKVSDKICLVLERLTDMPKSIKQVIFGKKSVSKAYWANHKAHVKHFGSTTLNIVGVDG